MVKRLCPHCKRVLPEKFSFKGISPICPFCGKPISFDISEGLTV